MLNVVAALITSKNKLLLAQRSKGNLKDYWEFPGGKVEEGETERAAIVREVQEELGTQVEIVKEISVFEYTYSFAEIRLKLFHCKVKGSLKNLAVHDSHKKIIWVTYKDTEFKLAPLDEKIFNYLKNNYAI